MSTKIYNAYKYNGKIGGLLQVLGMIRKQFISSKAYELRRCYKEYNKNFYDLVNAIKVAMFKGQDIPLNINASACVYFNNGNIYVQFFGLDTDMVDKIDADLSFQDFHFQDSTDKPEDIAKEEWEYREMIWGKIFKNTLTPADAGLIYQFSAPSAIMNIVTKIQNKDF